MAVFEAIGSQNSGGPIPPSKIRQVLPQTHSRGCGQLKPLPQRAARDQVRLPFSPEPDHALRFSVLSRIQDRAAGDVHEPATLRVDPVGDAVEELAPRDIDASAVDHFQQGRLRGLPLLRKVAEVAAAERAVGRIDEPDTGAQAARVAPEVVRADGDLSALLDQKVPVPARIDEVARDHDSTAGRQVDAVLLVPDDVSADRPEVRRA